MPCNPSKIRDQLTHHAARLRSGVALGVLCLGTLSQPALAQEVPAAGYVKADGTRTSDPSAARQSWRNDAEFNGNWGLKAIQADGAYMRGFTGLGANVGVIDQPVWLGHPEFSAPGKATFLTTAGIHTYNDPYIPVKAGDPFRFDGSIYVDGSGDVATHGTHVAGIAAAARNGTAMQGVAFDAHITAADNGDPGPEDGIVKGNDGNVYRAAWQAMIDAKVDVITNSWGIGINSKLPEWRYAQAAAQFGEIQAILGTPGGGAYDGAIAAARAGIVVEFSAGNDDGADPDAMAGLAAFVPKIERTWIATMSVARDANAPNGVSKSGFSSVCGYAKYFCVAAPGSAINSSIVDADTSGKQPGDILTDLTPSYAQFNGTSMAGPFVSGSLAVLKQRFSYLSNGDLNDILKTTATDLGEAGVDGVYGWGLINLDKAMGGPGQFLGRFQATLPGGASDVWSNDISDTVLKLRNQESAAVMTAWEARKAELGLGDVYTETPGVRAELARMRQAKLQVFQGDLDKARDVVREFLAASVAYGQNPTDAAASDRFGAATDALASNRTASSLYARLPKNPQDQITPSQLAAWERDTYPKELEAFRAKLAVVNEIPTEFETQERDKQAYLARDKAGSLVKGGAGTLILAGNNTYTGGTTVAGGTLQIGNGGTTGSILGDVRDDGVLAFRRSDATGFAGAISGTGAVVQAGTGTLTLSGTNTYTGGTGIQAGTLAVSGGSALADAGAVSIGAAGRLQLLSSETIGGLAGAGAVDLGAWRLSTGADGASTTYDGAIGGAGGLTKLGAGRLNLTGTSGYTGATEVGAGLLSVNGSLASKVEVGAGGALGGTGRIAALDVASGGVLAPGNSVGTLSVTGDARFAPNSVYQVEVAPDGRMDALVVGGVATLGGVRVEVLKENAGRWLTQPEFRSLLGASAPIVSAAGGVSGTFGPFVNTDFTFLGADLDYSATGVNLTLERNAVAFASLAGSGNGRAAATAVDGMAPGTPLYEAVLASNASTVLAPLFDGLTGEVHADMGTALLENGRFLRSEALERAGTGADGAPSGEGVALAGDASGATVAYLRGIGNWGESEGESGNADADRATGGFLVGVDGTIDGTWRIGALAGYSNTSLSLGGARGFGSADAYEFGLYAGRRFANGLGLRGGASYVHAEIDTTRSVALAGLGSQELSADYGADGGQAFGELGWRFGDAKGSAEPFANLAYEGLHADAFGEDAGTAALVSGGFTNDALFSTLGVHLATSLDLGSMAVTAKGTLGWRHAYGDTTPDAQLAFAAGGPSFIAQGTPIAQDAFVMEAGASAAITKNLSLDVAYQGQFAKDTTDNGFKAGLSWKF